MECGFWKWQKSNQNKMFTPMSYKSKIIPKVLCNNRRENKYTKKLVHKNLYLDLQLEALERYYIFRKIIKEKKEIVCTESQRALIINVE